MEGTLILLILIWCLIAIVWSVVYLIMGGVYLLRHKGKGEVSIRFDVGDGSLLTEADAEAFARRIEEASRGEWQWIP